MRMLRRKIVRPEGGQYFHVVSRVVDRRLIFGEREKEVLYRLMRQFEGFSGLEVLSYCLMGNHFHFLIHVPVRPAEISEPEVLRRLRHIYSPQSVKDLGQRLRELRENGRDGEAERILGQFRRRMHDLSVFVQEVKQRFSRWYNREKDRAGTLWEGRFRMVVVEGEGSCLAAVAAYIDLNPVRADVVEDPKDYRWSSYGEACRGSDRARDGIVRCYSPENGGRRVNWQAVAAPYRGYLMGQIVDSASESSVKGVAPDARKEDGGRRGVLMRRVRSFTEGLAVGSRDFLRNFFETHRDHFGPRRRHYAHETGIADGSAGSLYSCRRVDPKPG